MFTYALARKWRESGIRLREYHRWSSDDGLKRQTFLPANRKKPPNAVQRHRTKQIAGLDPYRIQAGDRH
ncbi:hypothetical protein KEC55_26595 [Burkholderia cepacia]|uniref:hypothetical protein n=1 Tax=Burkholderia cepacia TaxID=292 RepID=UPI00249EE0CF|nr:hypothetical protein [Burkholderia cepacia]WGY70599.1 hypothetical protein KEC55_26595 [Burkholderia cepacia]